MKSFNNQVLAQKYNEYFRYGHNIICDMVSEFPKNIKIIDFGCGSGGVLKKLKDMGYSNLSGVEQSKEMYNQIDHKIGIFYNTDFFHFAEINTEQYDLAIFSSSIHLISDGGVNLHSVLDDLNTIAKNVLIMTTDFDNLENTTIIKLFPKLLETEKTVSYQQMLTIFKHHGYKLDDLYFLSYNKNIRSDVFKEMLRNRFVSPMNFLTNDEIECAIRLDVDGSKYFRITEYRSFLLFKQIEEYLCAV